MNIEKVKIRLHIPMALILIVLLIYAVIGYYYNLQNQIDSATENLSDYTEKVYRQMLNHDAEILRLQIPLISENPGIKNAWLAKDRNILFSTSNTVYKDILNKLQISHLYFIDLNGTCFLRVHNREKYGDHIDRHTLYDSVKSGKLSHGIELGPYGTFTLRVVHPWIINGRLTGYIEIGKEIGFITPLISDFFGIKIIVLIGKQHLDRRNWEEGLKMVGLESSWDNFKNYVITDEILIDSRKLKGLIDGLPAENLKKDKFERVIDEKKYILLAQPLLDAAGNSVGYMLIMNDITATSEYITRIKIYVITGSVIIGVFIIIFFWLYLGRIRERISEAADKLYKEAVEHKKAVHKLHASEKDIHHILDIMPEGIFECDQHGAVTYANRTMEQFTGYTGSELTAMNISALIAEPEHNQALMNFLKSITVKSPATPPEIAGILKKDGGRLTIHLAWNFRHNEFGQVNGIACIITAA